MTARGVARDAPSASDTPRSDNDPLVATLRRRRLAPADRRAELVDAAIVVLRAGVDEGNWVAEVTRAAGAAKGTFYLYFPSWEDMLAVVREHLIDECNAPIRNALAAQDRVDWWTVLEDQCGRFVDVVTEFGRHHALIFHAVLPIRWSTIVGSRTLRHLGYAAVVGFLQTTLPLRQAGANFLTSNSGDLAAQPRRRGGRR